MPVQRPPQDHARYVVATPRALRGKGPTALSRLSELKGVKIEGAGNPDRVVVVASGDTMADLASRFRDTLIIEQEHFYPRA